MQNYTSFTLNEMADINTLFTTDSSFLIRNHAGQIVEKGSFCEKIRYIAMYIFTLGNYSVKHQYKEYCKRLEQACVRPTSDERISVQNTCEIFRSIFSDNLNTAADNLKDAKGKTEISEAKREVKKAINQILVNGYYTRNNAVKGLQEINFHPRLVEARYALSHGVEVQEICAGNVNSVFTMFDRNGPEKGKALAIFKECPKSEIEVEVDVYETLRKPNKINVKHTTQAELEIQGCRRNGIFQKFIKGEMISKRQEPTDQEAVEQIQLIGIFDLINLNSDRNNGNFMIDQKDKVFAIDHARINWGNAYKDDRVPMIKELDAGLQPFSQRVIDHINSLDSEIHVSESVRLDNRIAHVKNIIEFLKWSVSDNREFPLTLNQIYTILNFCGGADINILCGAEFDSKNYDRTVELALSHILSSGDWGSLLTGAFPQIDAIIANSGGLFLKKLCRLESISKIHNELCLDLLLENGDSIKKIDVSKLRYLDISSIKQRFESLAKGTKYFDADKNSFTSELSKFLQRLNVEGVVND